MASQQPTNGIHDTKPNNGESENTAGTTPIVLSNAAPNGVQQVNKIDSPHEQHQGPPQQQPVSYAPVYSFPQQQYSGNPYMPVLSQMPFSPQQPPINVNTAAPHPQQQAMMQHMLYQNPYQQQPWMQYVPPQDAYGGEQQLHQQPQPFIPQAAQQQMYAQQQYMAYGGPQNLQYHQQLPTPPPAQPYQPRSTNNNFQKHNKHNQNHDGHRQPPVCKFFIHNKCNKGDACKFQHPDPSTASARSSSSYSMASPPPAFEVDPEKPVVSIDVECIASGMHHNDRVIAQIALVDQKGETVCNLYVTPTVAIASYLTPLTGLTAELLAEKGTTFESAMEVLRSKLPENAVLVGQNIRKDVEWLGLVEGVDFDSMRDLVALMKVWNSKFRSYSYFGLDHYASVWLNESRDEGEAHDAVADARKSVMLYNEYIKIMHDHAAVAAMGEKVLKTPVKPSFSKLHATFEGCCQGNKKTCKCGAPFYT